MRSACERTFETSPPRPDLETLIDRSDGESVQLYHLPVALASLVRSREGAPVAPREADHRGTTEYFENLPSESFRKGAAEEIVRRFESVLGGIVEVLGCVLEKPVVGSLHGSH